MMFVWGSKMETRPHRLDPFGLAEEEAGIVSDGFGHPDQIPVELAPVLAPAVELDRVGASLGAASMVRESRSKLGSSPSHPVHQPGDDPNAVPEQAGVGRCRDSDVDDGRVAPDGPTALDTFALGEVHQSSVDSLPGLRPDLLHVGLKRLMAGLLLEAQPHKAAERSRVLEMELELPVAQAMDLLEQRDPKDLVATESGPASVAAAVPQKILLHELPEFERPVQNPGHHLQLLAMLVSAP
jgi:hypothetical protein